MIRAADMCNTIPDEKVVLTYTSYLCARLLNIRQETRAARTIQLAWRKHILHKNRGKIKVQDFFLSQKLLENTLQFSLDYVSSLNSPLDDHLFLKLNKHSFWISVQYYASFTTIYPFFQLKIKAAIKIQRFVRSWLQRLHVKKQESRAIIIQKYARGFLARKRTMQLQKEKQMKAAKVVLVS